MRKSQKEGVVRGFSLVDDREQSHCIVEGEVRALARG